MANPKGHPATLRPGQGRIDLSEALILRYRKGLTFQQIADHFGVSKPAVFQRLRKFKNLLLDPDKLRAFQERQKALLTGAKLKLLQELTKPEKLKKASLNNLLYAFNRIDNAHRLQAGRATSHVAVQVSESEEKALKKYAAEASQGETHRQWEENGEVPEEEIRRLQMEEENQEEAGSPNTSTPLMHS